MEKSLTVAEKVRRQLKAGRQPKTKTAPRSVFDAVRRLVDEADRARELMHKSGLIPDDISLALLCRVIGVPGMPRIQRAPLPPPGNIGAYIQQLEELAALTRVDFLGILWQQEDRDPKAKAPRAIWITELADDKQASLELLAFKNELTSTSARQMKGTDNA